MNDVTGIQRLRRAIDNQSAAGEACFSLPVGEAYAICDEVEDELARTAWAASVPAPVDADGEVVPLTTEVMYGDDGRELEIIFFKFNIHNPATYWAAFCKNKDGNRGYAAVSSIHLRRPDSWEKLEKDVSKAEDKGICGYFGFAMNRPCSAECPARDARDSCAVTAMHDVMRRAEALAERDAKGAEQ